VLARGLEALGLSVGARDANFLLVHVGDRHTALCRKLEADGILIRDRHGRHPALDGCVRIGIGSAGQVARTLAAVRKALCAPPVLDALIFDLDGTLVDVRASCRRAIVHTVTTLLAAARLRGSALKGRELGLDDGSVVDGSVVDAYKARGGLNNDWDCAAAILADHGVAADYDSIVATHQAAYRGDDWDGFIADEPWLLAPAEQARISAALPLALVTGRPTAEAHFTLARPDCRLAFATVVGMDDVAVGKPDPAGIVMACAALGVAPACVAYIGDAVDDMRAAKAAGAFAIGVLAPGNGHASGWPERLALAGADVICNDVGEVLRWLSQSK
jgi:HAD superfamily phosphatase